MSHLWEESTLYWAGWMVLNRSRRMIDGMAGRTLLGLEYVAIRDYARDHGATTTTDVDEWVTILGEMDEEYLDFVNEKKSAKQ